MIRKVKMVRIVRKPQGGLGPLGAGGKCIQRRNLSKLQPEGWLLEIQWILEDGPTKTEVMLTEEAEM